MHDSFELRPPPRRPRRPGLAVLSSSLWSTRDPLRGAGRALGGLAILALIVTAAPTLAGWRAPSVATPGAADGEVRSTDPGDQHGIADFQFPARSGVAAPSALAFVVTRAQPSCPAGWMPLGSFRVSTYVLATEAEFAADPVVTDPCGLEGEYRADFLYGRGVKLQGSGRTLDGRVVRYAGAGCFAEVECPATASGTCAEVERTVAVDPDLVPLGSPLWIDGVGHRVAEDTGSAIRGRHVDLYAGSSLTVEEAREVGVSRRMVCVPDR